MRSSKQVQKIVLLPIWTALLIAVVFGFLVWATYGGHAYVGSAVQGILCEIAQNRGLLK